MEPTLQALKNTYTPELAIIVYVGKEPETKYYLESHPIDKQGQLLEGRPLKAESITGMIEVFKTQHREKAMLGGMVPPYLLAYRPESSGAFTLAWYRPAEQRTLWFQKQLHIPSGPAIVPPMLYVARNKSLNVWAMGSGKRPDGKTAFYRAPFHNVDAYGSVCLGSAKAKKAEATFEDVIRYWEDIFWNSEFSHLNAGSPIKEGENLNLIWGEQVADPKRPFPMEVLQPLEKTTLQTLFSHGR